MDIAELVEETDQLLSTLGAFSFSDDLIDAVMSGKGDFEEDEEIRAAGENVGSRKADLEKLLEMMIKISDHPEQYQFWDSLGANGYSPGIFQCFCLALALHSTTTRRIGALLYVTLLRMDPFSMIWNAKIFNQILLVMVTATQAMDSNDAVSADDIKAVKLTGELLENLVITKSFKSFAGNDVIIALIELAVKACTVSQKNKENITRQAMKFLYTCADLCVEYTLPQVVLALILDFLPSTKQVTVHVAAIRDLFLEFCQRKVDQENLLKVCKHVVMRCPDRQALRDNGALVAHQLIKMMEDPMPMVEFLLKASRAQKNTLRVLSLDVLRRLIDDEQFPLSEDLEMEIVAKMRVSICDPSPNVRAAALVAIAALIPGASENVARGIGIISNDADDHLRDELMEILHRRIIDEKLNVRKAALKCLNAIMNVNKEVPDLEIMQMIAERTRDRAVAMRQEAMNVLSAAMDQFDSKEILYLWFEHVLPLSLDVDTRTQDLALKHIDRYLLGLLKTEKGIDRVQQLNPSHMELMKKVINVYKQKSMSLSSYCKNLESNLDSDSHKNLWKLENIIVSVTPQHSKKNFLGFWDERDYLPVEYLAIVANLEIRAPEVLGDVEIYLRRIASGDLIDAEFGRIHWMVIIMSAIADSMSEAATELIAVINERISSSAVNEMLNQQQMKELVCSIYLLGALFEYSPQLKDFDFTGLQLMIAEKLPNQVSIPEKVRAVSTIALGKLCLCRRDISSSFVAAFAAQLHMTGNASVKCNSLVVLCDLCVKYSATVDQYVMDMSGCFADSEVSVRMQALLIMTKLIAEDYVKIRQLIFFRFVYSLVDNDAEVSKFAQNCLFDIINAKDPRLMVEYFLRTLLYFNGFLTLEELNESAESREKFRIQEKNRRYAAYEMLIRRMSSAVMFRLMQTVCTQVFQEFIDGQKDLDTGSDLLGDTIYVMLLMEDLMEDFNSTESSMSDDPRTEKIVNESKQLASVIHDQLIHRVLPILNQMHRFLRSRNSPLQSSLRKFFRKLCEKHHSLLDDLKRQEPLLAAELENDITMLPTPVVDVSPTLSPRRTPFRSPLLSRIARDTPQRPLIHSATQSPILSAVQRRTRDDDNHDDDTAIQKRPPVPFQLED